MHKSFAIFRQTRRQLEGTRNRPARSAVENDDRFCNVISRVIWNEFHRNIVFHRKRFRISKFVGQFSAFPTRSEQIFLYVISIYLFINFSRFFRTVRIRHCRAGRSIKKDILFHRTIRYFWYRVPLWNVPPRDTPALGVEQMLPRRCRTHYQPTKSESLACKALGNFGTSSASAPQVSYNAHRNVQLSLEKLVLK